jgi:hypothetical protein
MVAMEVGVPVFVTLDRLSLHESQGTSDKPSKRDPVRFLPPPVRFRAHIDTIGTVCAIGNGVAPRLVAVVVGNWCRAKASGSSCWRLVSRQS